MSWSKQAAARIAGRVVLMLGAATLLLGLAAPASFAQPAMPFPVIDSGAVLTSGNPELLYRVDLDSLPKRPVIIVEVDPDGSHSDMTLEVEISNVTGNPPISQYSIGCPINPRSGPPDAWFSDGEPGAVDFEAELFFCGPETSTWYQTDADVIVRVLDFGSGGSPASVDVSIRAITRAPTELLLQQVSGERTITVPASHDTVFYADDWDESNGAGDLLWSGMYVFYPLSNPFPIYYPRHTLMGFSSLATRLPENAIVSAAQLNVNVMGFLGPVPAFSPIGVFAIADSPTNALWYEGNADAPGDEFFGAEASSSLAANYGQRTSSQAWLSPGGDTVGGALDSHLFSSIGPFSFDSSGIAAAVQDWVDRDDFNDGFLLRGTIAELMTAAVSFASSEYPDPALRPEMQVTFSQASPLGEGSVAPDLVDYLDEGEDFHWIYDLDDDGIVVTEINGICEDVSGGPGFTYPYRYTYAGDPGYVGLDCCTWQIYSDEAQTFGAGQALFFHDLDPEDPANIPPDTDSDGILDPCDNCIYTPNGPVLGTCMNGTTMGPTCTSDLECTGAGFFCDLHQSDGDGNMIGNACPEPGFGMALLVGTLAVVGCGRRGMPRIRPSC